MTSLQKQADALTAEEFKTMNEDVKFFQSVFQNTPRTVLMQAWLNAHAKTELEFSNSRT